VCSSDLELLVEHKEGYRITCGDTGKYSALGWSIGCRQYSCSPNESPIKK